MTRINILLIGVMTTMSIFIGGCANNTGNIDQVENEAIKAGFIRKITDHEDAKVGIASFNAIDSCGVQVSGSVGMDNQILFFDHGDYILLNYPTETISPKGFNNFTKSAKIKDVVVISGDGTNEIKFTGTMCGKKVNGIFIHENNWFFHDDEYIKIYNPLDRSLSALYQEIKRGIQNMLSKF